jgi:hypothetical protein
VGIYAHFFIGGYIMTQVDLLQVEISWLRQILEHIDRVIKSESMTDSEKVTAIAWLVRQTKSASRDE